METIVTSYQYGDNKRFTSIYTLPKNLDKDEIHLPPNTTLIAPPALAENQDALWDGTAWSVVDKEPIPPSPYAPV